MHVYFTSYPKEKVTTSQAVINCGPSIVQFLPNLQTEFTLFKGIAFRLAFVMCVTGQVSQLLYDPYYICQDY